MQNPVQKNQVKDFQTLRSSALQILKESDPERKCALTVELRGKWQSGSLVLSHTGMTVEALPKVGRPEKPVLIPPQKLPRRSVYTHEGRVILMHAIAHIEFNAINLALDAVYRFSDMPTEYYDDWMRVAAEESSHYQLICAYLAEQRCSYGDYPAHNGLWDMALRTDHDVLVRMALVPRVLEARGLDVTPGMIAKLEAAGDEEAAKVLTVIYEEEIGHVKIGSRWFKYCCEQRDLDMQATFQSLVGEYLQGELRGPYNKSARLEAGFTGEELDKLLGI